MKYYVVSDVHGYYTHLRNALESAGFFSETEPCRLIVCGDLLDRGDEARELADFMKELKDEGKLIYILGNHEQLLVECMQQIARGEIFAIASGMSHHHSNGTWGTLLQLSGMTETEAYGNPSELVRRVRDSVFYKELLPFGIDYFETGKYVFVHGWIPYILEVENFESRRIYDSDWRNADNDGWRRARWSNGMEMSCVYHINEPDKTVVCGHWHASYGHARFENKGTEWGVNADHSPFYGEGIIAIDGCTAVSQTVNCVVIDDNIICDKEK